MAVSTMATILDITASRKAALRSYATDGDLYGMATWVAGSTFCPNTTQGTRERHGRGRAEVLRLSLGGALIRASCLLGHLGRTPGGRRARRRCSPHARPWTERAEGVYSLAGRPADGTSQRHQGQGKGEASDAGLRHRVWTSPRGASAGAGWLWVSCCTGWCPRSTAGWPRSVASSPQGWPCWPLGSS